MYLKELHSSGNLVSLCTWQTNSLNTYLLAKYLGCLATSTSECIDLPHRNNAVCAPTIWTSFWHYVGRPA